MEEILKITIMTIILFTLTFYFFTFIGMYVKPHFNNIPISYEMEIDGNFSINNSLISEIQEKPIITEFNIKSGKIKIQAEIPEKYIETYINS